MILPFTSRKARPDILKFAVLVGDKKVIREAKKMFNKWIQTKGRYGKCSKL